jgi:hypothetical protein
VSGLRIAVQHHGSGADGLDEAFAEAGATVSSVVVYSWGPSDPRGAPRLGPDAPPTVPGRCGGLHVGTRGARVAGRGIRRRPRGDPAAQPRRAAGAGHRRPGDRGTPRGRRDGDPGPARWRLGAVVPRARDALRPNQPPIATVAARCPVRAAGGASTARRLVLTPAGAAILASWPRRGGPSCPASASQSLLPGSSRDGHAVGDRDRPAARDLRLEGPRAHGGQARLRPRSGACLVSAALVLCAHGTRDPLGSRDVRAVLAAVAERLPGVEVREAYVDVHGPEVAEVRRAPPTRGRRVAGVVVPLLLAAGYHVPSTSRRPSPAVPTCSHGRAGTRRPARRRAHRAARSRGGAARGTGRARTGRVE